VLRNTGEFKSNAYSTNQKFLSKNEKLIITTVHPNDKNENWQGNYYKITPNFSSKPVTVEYWNERLKKPIVSTDGPQSGVRLIFIT